MYSKIKVNSLICRVSENRVLHRIRLSFHAIWKKRQCVCYMFKCQKKQKHWRACRLFWLIVKICYFRPIVSQCIAAHKAVATSHQWVKLYFTSLVVVGRTRNQSHHLSSWSLFAVSISIIDISWTCQIRNSSKR